MGLNLKKNRHRISVRSTNLIQGLFVEERKRTKKEEIEKLKELLGIKERKVLTAS